MGSLSFARPEALLGLLVAAFLLWRALAPLRPSEVVLGTYAWLEREGTSGTSTAGGRRSVPAYVVFALASIVAASVAASGPRWGAPAAPARWRVVVDARASMALDDGTGETRAERGAARAAERLARLAERADRVEWLLPDGTLVELAPGERPAAARLAPAPGVERRLDEYDVAGTLVVTDLEPSALERAGWVATGAAPAPGFVGVADGTALDWDGAELVPRAEAPAPRDVVLAAEVVEPWARLVRLWAEARAFRVVPTPGARPVALVVAHAPSAAPPRTLVVGRAGWRARVDARPVGGLGAAWLAGDGDAFVRVAPGRIALGFEAFEPLGGTDPARFAVSVGRLLDGATLAPPGAIALSERARRGPSGAHDPVPPPRPEGALDADRALAAWLAALAAIAAVAALTLYAGASSPLPSSSAESGSM